MQFYVGVWGQAPPCNGAWVVSQLRATPNQTLTDFQKFSGVFSTPFKAAGFSGWVTTECSATGVGTLVRDAQHSTDGFTTIDVRIESLFSRWFGCAERQVSPAGGEAECSASAAAVALGQAYVVFRTGAD